MKSNKIIKKNTKFIMISFFIAVFILLNISNTVLIANVVRYFGTDHIRVDNMDDLQSYLHTRHAMIKHIYGGNYYFGLNLDTDYFSSTEYGPEMSSELGFRVKMGIDRLFLYTEVLVPRFSNVIKNRPQDVNLSYLSLVLNDVFKFINSLRIGNFWFNQSPYSYFEQWAYYGAAIDGDISEYLSYNAFIINNFKHGYGLGTTIRSTTGLDGTFTMNREVMMKQYDTESESTSEEFLYALDYKNSIIIPQIILRGFYGVFIKDIHGEYLAVDNKVYWRSWAPGSPYEKPRKVNANAWKAGAEFAFSPVDISINYRNIDEGYNPEFINGDMGYYDYNRIARNMYDFKFMRRMSLEPNTLLWTMARPYDLDSSNIVWNVSYAFRYNDMNSILPAWDVEDNTYLLSGTRGVYSSGAVDLGLYQIVGSFEFSELLPHDEKKIEKMYGIHATNQNISYDYNYLYYRIGPIMRLFDGKIGLFYAQELDDLKLSSKFKIDKFIYKINEEFEYNNNQISFEWSFPFKNFRNFFYLFEYLDFFFRYSRTGYLKKPKEIRSFSVERIIDDKNEFIGRLKEYEPKAVYDTLYFILRYRIVQEIVIDFELNQRKIRNEAKEPEYEMNNNNPVWGAVNFFRIHARVNF